MDKIYIPSKFPCSENIALKQLFSKFSQTCSLNSDPNFLTMSQTEQDQTMVNMLKIQGTVRKKQLVEDISVMLLPKKEDDITGEDASTSSIGKSTVLVKQPCRISDKARTLETVKMRESYQKKLKTFYMKQRYGREPNLCLTTAEKTKATGIIQGTEFAVAFRFYHPFLFNYSYRNSYENMKFSHEIVALGSNTLADLRDKIICHTDAGLCVEMENPNSKQFIGNAKDKYPSGFIFIDNVFYNDNRHPESFDYSEVIRRWADEKSIGPLQIANMESTRIEELSPRFGYPYVYMHQSKCEHIMVISDAWLLSNKDSLNPDDYPMYKGIHRFYSKHCTMCYTQTAKWICVDSDRLPHAKTFMCHECFVCYNYKDGQKVGNFRAYPFYDRSCVM